MTTSRSDATLNGKPLRRRVKARLHMADFLAPGARADRNHSRLRARHLPAPATVLIRRAPRARLCLTLAGADFRKIGGKPSKV
jgi:hypothetical protein